jgi:hypothetical protein
VQFVLLKKKKTSFIHNIPEDSVFWPYIIIWSLQ